MKKLYLTLFLLTSFSIFSQVNIEKDSLLNIAKSSKNDSIVIDAYTKLFLNEVYANVSNSAQYYNAIFKIAKNKNSNYAYAKGYILKGIKSDVSGKLDSSLYYYKKSLPFSKKCKATSMEGSANNNIGLLLWNQGYYYEALLKFNEALTLFEKAKRKDLQGNALSNIGLIYDEIDDFKKSEYYLLKALQIRKENNDQYGLSVSYINLGSLYNDLKNYDLALKNYKLGISIKQKENDLLGIATANTNMYTTLMILKRYEEAFKSLQTAEKICIENQAESNILENVYIGFSEYYLKINNILKAKEYNNKLFEVNKKTNDIQRLSSFYETQSKIAMAEKVYNIAYFSLQKSDSLKHITDGIELKKSINLFEAKYQSEKKEKEILQIKNELFKKEILTKKKNTLLIIISVITLFVIVLGYLFYRQQKLKNKQQEQEFKLKSAIKEIENQNKLQEQRLSISRDLHDNIGSQLTFIISSVDNVKYGFDINNDKLESKLTNISTFAKDTIVELRDTIWAMNSNEITFQDLENRINNFIEKAKEVKDKISFSFATDEDLKAKKLTSVEGMNVYRTIQEAINNSIKYADADIISITIKQVNSKTNIFIKDNGKGFDYETIEKGNGINNMKKRIEEIGGNFNLSSSNEGTKIEIMI
ncbi:tetratricopeptide repeat protein [Flavobacterium sp.]|uniref:tetratricopeptide repeat-containing sensor histidine kinase n=1 Tax=Flavobacterium sp. TaxID=239 RepID=UPI0037508A5B